MDALLKVEVDGSRQPTLIFDLESVDGVDQIDPDAHDMLSLCDLFGEFINCIIVISNTNEKFILRNGLSGANMIDLTLLKTKRRNWPNRKCVGGMRKNERTQARLFDCIGTNAADLDCFLAEDMSVDEFIAHKVRQVKDDLTSFPFQPILQALKKHT